MLWEDFIVALQYLKGAYKKNGDRLFSRACCNRTRGNGFKLKESKSRLDIKKNFFMVKVLKHWHRLPREGDRCAIPGNMHSQTGRGSEQPDLVEDVPAHCRGVGLDDL